MCRMQTCHTTKKLLASNDYEILPFNGNIRVTWRELLLLLLLMMSSAAAAAAAVVVVVVVVVVFVCC